MLSLVLALVAAEPALTSVPALAPVSTPPAKVAKLDGVTCKWVTGKTGMARQFCLTKREWRDSQIDRQQHLNEFTRRQLQINLTH